MSTFQDADTLAMIASQTETLELQNQTLQLQTRNQNHLLEMIQSHQHQLRTLNRRYQTLNLRLTLTLLLSLSLTLLLLTHLWFLTRPLPADETGGTMGTADTVTVKATTTPGMTTTRTEAAIDE